MNQTIYDLADSGGSVRIVVQKKLDGTFIMGISNGKDKPLICQGEREKVDQEFEEQLPGFLQKVKTAAIEAKLRAATEPETPRPAAVRQTVPAPPPAAPVAPKTEIKENEQPELDFGF